MNSDLQHAREPESSASERWLAYADVAARVPARLRDWLTEPGLLTARVQSIARDRGAFHLLKLALAPVSPHVQARLNVTDRSGLRREIEFTCGGERWIYAQSLFPESTVRRHPWLAEIGGSALGVALARVGGVERESLEYRELAPDHELAVAALSGAPVAAGAQAAYRVWARRAVYRLDGHPILVSETFLPVLQKE